VKHIEELNPWVMQRLQELDKRLKDLKLDNLGVKLVGMNAMFEDRFNEMIKSIDKKADRDEFERLDERLSGIINDIIQNFDRYPDRQDVLKALLILEDNVKFYSITLYSLRKHQARCSHR
jgi:hypothetical protein